MLLVVNGMVDYANVQRTGFYAGMGFEKRLPKTAAD